MRQNPRRLILTSTLCSLFMVVAFTPTLLSPFPLSRAQGKGSGLQVGRRE